MVFFGVYIKDGAVKSIHHDRLKGLKITLDDGTVWTFGEVNAADAAKIIEEFDALVKEPAHV